MRDVLLEIRNLTKIFRSGKKEIIANNNVSFNVYEGEILGILGPNGAGKTTLIKQIATLLIPDSGDILYKGTSIVKHPEVIRGRFSFLQEGMRNVYPYLTAEANLLYFAYLNHIPARVAKKKSEELLKRMGLYEVKHNYVYTFSSGMNKKLAIATCLINEPEIVFLDEPFSGLDLIASIELMDFLRSLVMESGKTFLIADHRLDFIEKVANRVLWIKDGSVVMEGSTVEMKTIRREKEFIVYLQNSLEAQNALKERGVEFQVLSDEVLKVEVSLSHKDYLSFIISNFEVLNIEKKDLDFEAIFKELYSHAKNN
jgi:ABC-2 type transport system ATP-binding protein/sodium transport system ATP-binding protein